MKKSIYVGYAVGYRMPHYSNGNALLVSVALACANSISFAKI